MLPRAFTRSVLRHWRIRLQLPVRDRCYEQRQHFRGIHTALKCTPTGSQHEHGEARYFPRGWPSGSRCRRPLPQRRLNPYHTLDDDMTSSYALRPSRWQQDDGNVLSIIHSHASIHHISKSQVTRVIIRTSMDTTLPRKRYIIISNQCAWPIPATSQNISQLALTASISKQDINHVFHESHINNTKQHKT